MVGMGPPGQLTELDLSLPQAPGEMTQLPVIKAEPQEVNQFLKVTPGKCVQRGTLPLRSWADRILYSLGPALPSPSTPPTSPQNILSSPPCPFSIPPVPFLHNLQLSSLLSTPSHPSHHSFIEVHSIAISPSIHLLIYPSICPSIHLSIYPSIQLEFTGHLLVPGAGEAEREDSPCTQVDHTVV